MGGGQRFGSVSYSVQIPHKGQPVLRNKHTNETNQTKHPAESRVVSWLVFCQFDKS